MDPISYVFSAYLNTIQSVSYRHIADLVGSDVKAVVVEYDGVNIPFQYQLWRVKDNSVCNNLSNNVIHFSDCTIKASGLFNSLCVELSKKPSDDWRHNKTKNMYCNAAVSFKPSIAKIMAASKESEFQLARKECNVAIAKTMNNHDSRLIKQRDDSCKRYAEMKK